MVEQPPFPATLSTWSQYHKLFLSRVATLLPLYYYFMRLASGANFMSKKLGVKIPPGRISPNFVQNFPHAFLLEDIFLLDLGKIYSFLELMKLAPSLTSRGRRVIFCGVPAE